MAVKRSVPKKSTGYKGDRYYRTEWRVTSPHRAPRIETYDIGFTRDDVIDERLGAKLAHARRQLESNTLRHGDEMELSKVYFIGKG
jgi:hypothetical protein